MVDIIEVKGKCKWAFVNKTTNDIEGNPIYSIDIKMSEDTFEKLKKEQDLHPRRKLKVDKETGDTYLVVTKRLYSRRGKELFPPKVMDNNEEPFDEEIGNGSTVAVGIAFLPYDNKFGKGKVTSLNYVKVLDLVKHSPEDKQGIKVTKVIDSDVDF